MIEYDKYFQSVYISSCLYFSVKEFDIPVSVAEGRAKLREEFLRNKHVTDIRSIDLLVIKVSFIISDIIITTRLYIYKF